MHGPAKAAHRADSFGEAVRSSPPHHRYRNRGTARDLLRRGSGASGNVPGRNPTATRLALIQTAQGWAMGMQGESEVSHCPMGSKGKRAFPWSWGCRGSRNAQLTGDAPARRCPGAKGSMPACARVQGESNRGRHAPFGKMVLYYNTHLATASCRIEVDFACPYSWTP